MSFLRYLFWFLFKKPKIEHVFEIRSGSERGGLIFHLCEDHINEIYKTVQNIQSDNGSFLI